MWLIFDKIEFSDSLMSRKGTAYSGYVVTGMKKGFETDPDEPYSKIIFDNTFTTVKQGDNSATMSLVEFFKACQSGDLVVMKSERAGAEKWNWKISEVENRTRPVLDANAFAGQSATKCESLVDPLTSIVTNVIMSMPEQQKLLSGKSVDAIIADVRSMYDTVNQLVDCPAGLKE